MFVRILKALAHGDHVSWIEHEQGLVHASVLLIEGIYLLVASFPGWAHSGVPWNTEKLRKGLGTIELGYVCAQTSGNVFSEM